MLSFPPLDKWANRVRCRLRNGQGWNWIPEPVAPALRALRPCLRVCRVRRYTAFPHHSGLLLLATCPGIAVAQPLPCPAGLPSLCQQSARQGFMVLIKLCKVEVQEHFLLVGDLGGAASPPGREARVCPRDPHQRDLMNSPVSHSLRYKGRLQPATAPHSLTSLRTSGQLRPSRWPLSQHQATSPPTTR